jgi:hypothetical protein
MRNTTTPNRRIQDGEKRYLLCSECEQIFSNWEKVFSEQIFVPLHDPEPVKRALHYGPWAMKFAVSISWRVLMYYRDQEDGSHLNEHLQNEASKALETWRLFLLDKKANTKQYEQHLLPVDVIENATVSELSPYINRYLLRSVHMDVIASQRDAFVYTKLGRIILFGFIHESHRHDWRGTELHVGHDKIKPRDYYIPGWVSNYINNKASHVMEVMRNISPRQRESIEEMIDEHIDEIAASEGFRAMEYDVMLSGNKAFRK